MSRARDLGSLINSTAAGKNIVINGGFDIWQRGTSVAVPIGGGYTADRWFVYRNATGCTVSRQLTNDTTNLPSIEYCLRVQRNAGDTSTALIAGSQSFESVNSQYYAGKTVTLSFWARRGSDFSNTGTFGFTIVSGTGTDQVVTLNYTGVNIVAYTGGLTLNTTWTKYVITGTIPTNANEIAVAWGNWQPSATAAGANDWFEITGFQLEEGSSATAFSRSGGDMQGELAKCQRYYIKKAPSLSDGYYATMMVINTTTTAMTNFPLPENMRVRPTVSFSNLSFLYGSGSNIAISSINNYSDQLSGSLGMYFNLASASTIGSVGFIYGSGSSYIELSAEL